MVCKVDGTVNSGTITAASIEGGDIYNRHESGALSLKQNTTDSVSNFWQLLYAQGILPKAAHIILVAWRPSTQKQYLVYLSRWLLFCSQRNVDPMQTDLKEILNFLVELFEGGVGYSGINTARSILSSFVLIPKDIGKNNFVKRCVKGIFELKTPRPHHCHVWDVSTIFQYVKSLGHNAELTLKFLTYKMVILATLILAQRVQMLSQLDLDFMDMTEQSFIFILMTR